MTPSAIALVTVSAFTHAFWNLLGKRQNSSSAFFLIASAAASVGLLPLLAYYGHALPRVPGSVWLLIMATGVFQTIYYVGLAAAYRHGDMSVAYPLVRALPPVVIAAISLALGPWPAPEQAGHHGDFGGRAGLPDFAHAELAAPLRKLLQPVLLDGSFGCHWHVRLHAVG
jgi:drug/metabolite transporter (DMT)-like permease